MTTVDELCTQAKECLAKKDIAQAVGVLEQAIELDSDHVAAHETLAGLCFVRGKYDRAIELYQRASALDPKNSAALVNMGAVLNKKKDFTQAAKVLRQALSRDRRCPEAYYNLGIAQRGLNQTAMAVSAYKEAIRLNPEMAEAYSNLGNVLVEMNNHSQAILNFRRAIELKPDFKKAIQGLRKAEDLAFETKQSRNPFGRLVDMEEVERRNQTAERKLVLSGPQRYEDRLEVHRLSKGSQLAAEAFLTIIKEELEASILQLSRLATEERHGRVWAGHLDDFREAVEKYQEAYKKLNESTENLRGHEEWIQKEYSVEK